jgi:GDP-L-fucose synthase
VMICSSCMYPRLADQPVAENSLLTGPLEPTNQWFAIAKIAALKMCQAYRRQQSRNFITVVPTNLYGPGDNFDPKSSHVVPAMLRKVETARKDGGPVEIWGTGTPQREFLYVDDAAAAIAALMEHYDHEEPINISGGETVSILELARRAAEIVGYEGAFETNPSKPDGMPIKQLDNSRISAMEIWQPKIKLSDGLQLTYDWYCRSSYG